MARKKVWGNFGLKLILNKSLNMFDNREFRRLKSWVFVKSNSFIKFICFDLEHFAKKCLELSYTLLVHNFVNFGNMHKNRDCGVKLDLFNSFYLLFIRNYNLLKSKFTLVCRVAVFSDFLKKKFIYFLLTILKFVLQSLVQLF